MLKRKGLTRIESIIVIACIVFLFVNIGALSAGARARAKKEVCLANTKTLTLAWQMYAEGNAGKLVNAAPFNGAACPSDFGCPAGTNSAAIAPMASDIFYSIHKNEKPWVGITWQSGTAAYVSAPQCAQICAIKTGALWKYTQDLDIYRCPDGNKNALVAYSIIDSINGKYQFNGGCGMTDTPASLMAKNINQIGTPQKRIVFVEEGQATPDSYAVYYACQRWYDTPAVNHKDGTSLSFADGHSEYWKWKSQWTIDMAISRQYAIQPPSANASAFRDLYRVQIGCWGKLGYTPSVPIE